MKKQTNNSTIQAINKYSHDGGFLVESVSKEEFKRRFGYFKLNIKANPKAQPEK